MLHIQYPLRINLDVKTCEVFPCFVPIDTVYYVDFFVFFVLRRCLMLQVLTLRMNPF